MFVARDIAERKKLESQREAAIEKLRESEIIIGSSLKTHLLGYIELILKVEDS